MTDRNSPTSPDLSPTQRAAIEDAVKQTAWAHLRSRNAAEALSYYEPDAIVASHGVLYPSFERFSQDVTEFYGTLDQVDVAAWDEMHVQVLSERVAVLTATVRWSSTDRSGVDTDLKGVWTAVFVKRDDCWRICTRHESFEPAHSQS